MIEHGVVELLRDTGVGERMDRVGLTHDDIELRFDGRSQRLDFRELTRRTVMVYAQTEIVKDLIARRLADNGQVLFEARARIESGYPRVRFTHNGTEEVLECDFVAACDGFHDIGRAALSSDVVRTFEKSYPFGWLGILADVAPSCKELAYAHHPNGSALHNMRSDSVIRLYLQVPAGLTPTTGPTSGSGTSSPPGSRFATAPGR